MKCPNTHTRTQGRQGRSEPPEGGEGVESPPHTERQTGGRSIDIVMLITPHIYRSSDSIGAPSRSAASKRGGEEIGPYLAIWSNIWAERLLNVHPLPQPPRQFGWYGWDVCVQVGCAQSYCTPTTIPSSLSLSLYPPQLGCYE